MPGEAQLRPLSTPEQAAYAGGNYGKSLVWSSLETFLLFFLTDLVGLGPAEAGLVILIGLVWDGVSDPLMGLLADRTYSSRLGRYGAYLLVGAPLCGASFVLVFRAPDLSENGALVYALLAGLALRTGYTICDVPHNALLARATFSSRERAVVSGMRYFFSSLGGFTMAAASAVILAGDSRESEIAGFETFAIWAGLAYTITIYAAWWATRRVDVARGPGAPAALSARPSLGALVSNGQFQVLLLIALTAILTFPLFQKSLVYFAKYVLHEDTWASRALIVIMIAQALSIPGWIVLARRFDKARCLRWAFLGAGGAFVASCAASLVHPTAGLVMMAWTGAALAGVSMLLWAIIPDVVDFAEWSSGARREGLTFGVFTFVLKAGAGLGAAALGGALALAGFEPDVEQPARVQVTIGVMMVAWPTLGVLACAVLTRRYRLSHRLHARITRAAPPAG